MSLRVAEVFLSSFCIVFIVSARGSIRRLINHKEFSVVCEGLMEKMKNIPERGVEGASAKLGLIR